MSFPLQPLETLSPAMEESIVDATSIVEFRDDATEYVCHVLRNMMIEKYANIQEDNPVWIEFACPYSFKIAQQAISVAVDRSTDKEYVVVDGYVRNGRSGRFLNFNTEKFVFVVRKRTKAEFLVEKMRLFYNKEYLNITNSAEEYDPYDEHHKIHHHSKKPVSHTQFLPSSTTNTGCVFVNDGIFSLDDLETSEIQQYKRIDEKLNDIEEESEPHEEELREMIAEYLVVSRKHDKLHKEYERKDLANYYNSLPVVDDNTIEWLQDTNRIDNALKILLEDHMKRRLIGEYVDMLVKFKRCNN